MPFMISCGIIESASGGILNCAIGAAMDARYVTASTAQALADVFSDAETTFSFIILELPFLAQCMPRCLLDASTLLENAHVAPHATYAQ